MWDGCSGNPPNRELVPGRYVITFNGNCSLTRKAQIVEVQCYLYAYCSPSLKHSIDLQTLGGVGLIILTPQALPLPANDSYDSITIPLALMSQTSKEMLMVCALLRKICGK